MLQEILVSVISTSGEEGAFAFSLVHDDVEFANWFSSFMGVLLLYEFPILVESVTHNPIMLIVASLKCVTRM